jgi:proteasome maturation protein
VPRPSYSSHTRVQTSAPSAPGLHDTLRANLGLTSSISAPDAVPEPPQSAHPLEARLTAWRGTADALKFSALRRTYGIAEPVKRGMELRIAGAGEWRPLMLGGGTPVHSDILSGRDWELGWEDVFGGKLMLLCRTEPRAMLMLTL